MNDDHLKGEVRKRKMAIYDTMSTRGQKYIDKIGFDKWDPFQEPKDPIDIRKDKTKRTSQMLVREFLQSRDFETNDNDYNRGALDIAMGIVNEQKNYQGMFDFSCWYKDLLEKEGLKDKDPEEK